MQYVISVSRYFAFFCFFSALVPAAYLQAKEKPLPWELDWNFKNFPVSSFFNEVRGFDFSGQASPPGCSGSIVNFGQSEGDKAILLTNAHCVGMLSEPQDTIYRNKPYAIKVKVYKDKDHTIMVQTTKIIYGVIRTYDMALVELGLTYKELADKGVRSRAIANNPVAIGTQIILASGYFRSVTECPVLDIIPLIREDVYQNSNSYKYRDCNSIHGTSGSPLINALTGEVVGLNYTGNDDGEICTYNNPCEVDANGNVRAEKGASYGDPVHEITTCLNARKQFDLLAPDCQLPR